VNRFRLTAIALVAGALGATGVAWAASLTITPQKLTTFGYCIVRASTADADVNQSSPSNNQGSSVDLYVRSASGGNRHTFVKFDLSSCNAPTTAVVTTATLSLHMSSAPGVSRTYEARRVTTTWTETAVNWTNQPAAGSVTSTATTGTTSNVRRTWTVTADVQAWLNGTAANHGSRISDATQDDPGSREARFVSKEKATASQRPQLTIQYYAQ